MINILTSVVVFVLYTSYIITKYGVQESISASWYRLSGAKWILFTLFTWGTAIPIILLDLGNAYTLGAVSLACVGVAGAFRDNDLTKVLHNGFTYLSIVLLCYGLWADGEWWVAVTGVLFYTITMWAKMKNKTWWDEHFIYFAIIGGIAMKIYLT